MLAKEFDMEQLLQKSYGLNDNQLAAIRQLETICNQYEGLAIRLNWSTLQSRPQGAVNDFLYYRDGDLVGYLALYSFNKKEAEVSAMVHPYHRRQGIFKELLAAARLELGRRHIPDVLFICERASVSGARCMEAIEARFDFSEYMMRLSEAARPGAPVSNLEFRPALPEDIVDLAHMDEVCFGVPAHDRHDRYEHDLADDNRRILVALIGPEQIGKIGVLFTGLETYIYALCVLPEHRHQGYGKAILAHTVEELLNTGHKSISLEVAFENERALRLYKQCGFEPVTAYDYYRLPVQG